MLDNHPTSATTAAAHKKSYLSAPDEHEANRKGASSELKILISHVNCPGKLLPLCLVEDLLNGHTKLLTPTEITTQWGDIPRDTLPIPIGSHRSPPCLLVQFPSAPRGNHFCTMHIYQQRQIVPSGSKVRSIILPCNQCLANKGSCSFELC